MADNTSPRSWRPEVRISGNGGKWASNPLRFATEKEARDNARDLMGRWMAVVDCRAAPSDDPVNYLWTGSGLSAVNVEGAANG